MEPTAEAGERSGQRRRRPTRPAPSGVVLTVLWIVTTAAVVAMLAQDVRSTDRYDALRRLLQGGYVAALLWHLGRTGAAVSQLPRSGSQTLARWHWGPWVPVVGILLVFAATVLSDEGVDLLMLLLIPATAWILLVWRREIRLVSLAQGLGVALVAYLAGLSFAHHELMSESAHRLLSVLSAPMFVAGGLLFDRTRLGGARLYAGRYLEVPAGVARGALLFVPLGLFNAADGAPGPDIAWVSEWWMPLALPWFSGVWEETWFRLLLVGLCYFLLRPALRTGPAAPVAAAVLFSGLTFGLGHSRSWDGLLSTGLLFGVPLAAIFAKRDWEHAVGAHYMINLVPWMMLFLETDAA